MSERLKFFTQTLLWKNFDNLKNQKNPRLAVFKEDGLSMKALVEGFYELPYLKMLENFVFKAKPGKCICLDIGANIGNHSAFFSNHFKEVLAFEPNLRTFKLLEANAMLFDNIKVFNIGFSSHESKQTAYYDLDNIGGASIHTKSTNKIQTEFNLQTLDSFLTDDQIENIDLIKIDVEGHEKEIFLGASKLLKNGDAIICMEIMDYEIVDGTSEALKTLNGYGYDYMYEPFDTAPFGAFNEGLAKLTNALSVLFFNNKILENYELRQISSRLSNKKYDMLILSKSSLL